MKEKSNGHNSESKGKKASKRACGQSTNLENVLSTAMSQPGSLSGRSLPSDSKNYLPMATFHTSASGKTIEQLS